MWKWLRYALVILAVAIVAGIVWPALRGPPDPVYKGKRLSVWLQRSTDSSRDYYAIELDTPEIYAAIRQAGTNSIPILLKMLEAKDSDLKLKLIRLAQRQHFIRINFVTAKAKNIQAMRGFEVLGDSASEAVPELINIYNQNVSKDSQNAVILSLAGIGPAAENAVPLLAQVAATNRDNVARFSSLLALGLIHSEPETAVPALIGLLSDPNSMVRYSAMQSLGHFGRGAKPATSVLLELLKEQDRQARNSALSALSEIYAKPEWDPPILFGGLSKYRSSIPVAIITGFGTMGTNAEPAVPALVKFLTDPDEGVRISATNSLKAIDPEAAAKAGVK